MSAPKLNDHYRTATFVDSLYGGNGSAFILQTFNENNEFIKGSRLEVPKSTGDRGQDKVLWNEINESVKGWQKGGEFPQHLQHLIAGFD